MTSLRERAPSLAEALIAQDVFSGLLAEELRKFTGGNVVIRVEGANVYAAASDAKNIDRMRAFARGWQRGWPQGYRAAR